MSNQKVLLTALLFALTGLTAWGQRFQKSYFSSGNYPSVFHSKETIDGFIFQATTLSDKAFIDLNIDKSGNNDQFQILPHDLTDQGFIRGRNDTILTFSNTVEDSTSTFWSWSPGGTMLWEKVIKFPGDPAAIMFSGYLEKGIELADGYLLMGVLYERYPGNIFKDYFLVVKIDFSGNIIYQIKKEEYRGRVSDIKLIGDKFFFKYSPAAVGPSFNISWIDINGNMAPPTVFLTSFNLLQDFISNSAGDVVLVGFDYHEDTGQEPFGRALCYDDNWQLLWEKAGWPELDYATQIRKGTDYIPERIIPEGTGWVMAGKIEGPQPAVFMAVLDSLGNIQKLQVYPINPIWILWVTSLIKTWDEGYLLSYRYGNNINVIKTDTSLIGSPNLISGKVVQDPNLNCLADTTEPVLSGWIIELTNTQDTLFSFANLAGEYVFPADTGAYQLAIRTYNSYWEPCQNNIPLFFAAPNQLDTTNFNLQAAVECPQMEVDICLPFARRCFTNNLYLNYCNNGTIAADSAWIQVVLDPFMTYVSSQIPVTAIFGDTLVFSLGNVPINTCDQFTIQIYADCDSTQLGQTVCVSAHIYPDTFCVPIPAWSGAQLAVGGYCEQDSIVFWAWNIGTAATQVLDYVIIEDMVVWLKSSFDPLLPGGTDTIRIAADGSTYGLLSEQEPGYPYDAFSPLANGPSAWVEACNWNGTGLFPGGYITQFPNEDGNPVTASDCNILQGSYDPNDKYASPEGVGDKHQILPGTPLQYLIRFQNTGTDTAFIVVIRDDLSPLLDPLSVQILASSHPCKVTFEDHDILKYTFDHILLPDSNIAEAASHGFVKFRILPRNNVPIGSVIENTAAIFFDFNAPVFTNTYFHTIDTNFIQKTNGTTFLPTANTTTQFSPNPCRAGGTTVF